MAINVTNMKCFMTWRIQTHALPKLPQSTNPDVRFDDISMRCFISNVILLHIIHDHYSPWTCDIYPRQTLCSQHRGLRGQSINIVCVHFFSYCFVFKSMTSWTNWGLQNQGLLSEENQILHESDYWCLIQRFCQFQISID